MAFMPTVNLNLAATVPALTISTDTTRPPLLISNTNTPEAHPAQANRTDKSAISRIVRPLSRLMKRRRPSGREQRSNHELSLDATTPSANLAESTTQSIESSSSLFYCNGDISVSSADSDDIDRPTVRNTTATRPEVYIRSMLTSGKGLASWSPRPRDPVGERGVVPGDVGTFSAQHGFKKIFNLQEDKGAIRSSKIFGKNYSLPKMDHVVTHKEELSVGEMIVKGTSVKTQYAPDGEVASCEFRMLEPEGAVLALTSSADLEEFRSHVELRDFIIDNAASLYRYANSIQRLDYHESLYIITGCIKSDSWALAAYNDLPDPQNNVLKLIRTGSSGSTPAYVWTDRGTAEARSGSTQNGGTHKDQCLFLQGFKVAFSAAFRSRMKGNLPNFEDSCDGEGTSDSDASDENDRRQGDGGGNRNSNDARGGGIGSKRCSRGGPSDGLFVEYFPNRRTEDELHPCDRINMQLLRHTTADVALSHDDDWRFALENASNMDVRRFNILDSNTVSIRNGKLLRVSLIAERRRHL
ncbi:hypothetical protein H1R20_g7306, partial [Candolleomyces eurysporus]